MILKREKCFLAKIRIVIFEPERQKKGIVMRDGDKSQNKAISISCVKVKMDYKSNIEKK